MNAAGTAALIAVVGSISAHSQAQVSFEIFGAGFAANDISADGSVIVGNSVNDGLYQQARWTNETGYVLLGQATGPIFGTGAGAPQVSNDGTRVSSTIASLDNTYITVGLWTQGEGWQEVFPPLLQDAYLLDNSYGSAWALSGDGTTVAGLFWRDRLTFGGGSAHAFSWDETSGGIDLGSIGTGRDSRVNGINLDGTVAVGWESLESGEWQPAVWVNGTRTILAATPVLCEASAVNDNGTVICGYSWDAANATSMAAVWTWDGAGWNEQLLGVLPGTPIGPFGGRSFASAISGDGTVVVGTNRFIDQGPFSSPTGFIWTAAEGLRDIRDVLADSGISLPVGFQIDGLTGISQDGTKIVGVGSYPANYPDYYSILIDLDVSCLPDVNGDGMLSPADFSSWIAAFNEVSIECDQNGDGACSPADFSAWIANYNAGC